MLKRLAMGSFVAALTLVAGCSDELTVPNYNQPTPGGIAGDPGGLQLAVAGVLAQDRALYDEYVADFGIFGREMLDYFPTDGRSHTHYVAQNPLDRSGFAVGNWTGPYRNMRNLFNLRTTIEAATALSDAEKQGARGFAGTYEAYTVMMVSAQRHDYGAITEIAEDPREIKPFVSRDSAQNYVAGKLDEAYAQLTSAGAEFPFTLHSGFSENGDFSSAAGFAQYNRALKARIEVWRASLGNPACGAGGDTCYQNALTALQNSFIDDAGDLYAGPYHVFSSENGDLENDLNADGDPDRLAHPSIKTDRPTKLNGDPDDRYTAKIRDIAARGPSGGAENGITTDVAFNMYPSLTSPAPIIRNEELILIRAEARYFTGDPVGALADINTIRTRSGGLAPRGPFVSDDDFVTELLLQRRMSLLWEGHRWVDVRRFGRLATLPKDLPNHVIHAQQPIPAASGQRKRRPAARR
jgi:hypothetical protein